MGHGFRLKAKSPESYIKWASEKSNSNFHKIVEKIRGDLPAQFDFANFDMRHKVVLQFNDSANKVLHISQDCADTGVEFFMQAIYMDALRKAPKAMEEYVTHHKYPDLTLFLEVIVGRAAPKDQ